MDSVLFQVFTKILSSPENPLLAQDLWQLCRIFPIGPSCEASRWGVCYQQGLPHLVYLSVGVCVCVCPLFGVPFNRCFAPTS